MTRVLALLWRWSWVATLPIAVFFFLWLDGTARSYHAFNLRRIGGDTCTLERLGRLRLDSMLRHVEVAALRTTAVPPGPGPRLIHLSVPESALVRLDAHLPASGFTFVDGAMSGADGKTQKVKVRYRGDNLYHWAYEKKSLRIKTKGTEHFDGMQSFNLVAPRTAEQLNNHLSARLGALLGLVTPRSELANVTLNGRLKGLYVLTEQIDEATLQRHGLEPGDTYVGDLIARSLYTGVDDLLFEHPGLWEKVPADPHAPVAPRAALERLVDLLCAPRTERVEDELAKLLDMEAFGAFAALEILCSTVHVDAVHNWRLYWDAARQRLVPIVWDLMGWHASVLPGPDEHARYDVVTSPLHVALLGNGAFLRARHAAIERFFASGADARFLAEVEQTIALLASTVAADPDVVELGEVVRPAAVRAALRKLAADVARVFADVKSGYLGAREPELRWAPLADGPAVGVAVAVESRSPVDGLVLRFAEPVLGPVTAEVSWWRAGQRVARDVSGAVAVRGSEVEIAAPLLADFVPRVTSMVPTEVAQNGLSVAPGCYELRLGGPPALAAPVEVEGRRGKAPLRARREAALGPRPFAGVVTPVPAVAERGPVVWDGEVVLDGVTVLERELVVRPGTTVRMRPGASLVLHAPLRALGTSERPIRILPFAKGQSAWGTVALQGRGCSGSELAFCEVSGGSGMSAPLAVHTAMLTVHDAASVAFVDCAFHDGTASDDLVHCVYSDVRFTRCSFTNAPSDALDLDSCRATVALCQFAKVGGDDLDLMASKVVVTDSVLGKCKGHAIVAGQSSRVLAVHCRLEHNGIGVLSKDGSLAALASCDIDEATLALEARLKSSRYGAGGEVAVLKCKITKAGTVATSDAHSLVRLHDSFVDAGLPRASRGVVIDPDVDSVREREAASPRVPPAPAGLAELGEAGKAAWARVSASTRGASPHGQ